MYGKFFASTFTGSMFGAGPDVFAVWGYVIANTVNSAIELNPRMLAAALGSTPERIESAIEFLCRPDPISRNKDHDGCRLIHENAFQYKVVSHALYRAIQNEEERREYNRRKQQESRSRRKKTKMSKRDVNDSQSQLRMSTMSAHTEAEAYAEKDKVLLPSAVIRLPATGNKEYAVTQDQFARWKELYPAVDVMQELRAMVGWLEGNPQRKKTTSGMNRFANNWLSKAQNCSKPLLRQPGTANMRGVSEDEAYAMWQGMSTEYRKQNPWKVQA